jgi:predicted RNA-binding protein associated with RNAse of E/G family
MVYERRMRSDGVYDGLGVRKEAGDVAVSRAGFSEYYIETKYYSGDGALRGTYYNVNTPVEVYPSSIRYIDLEVDVVVWTDGRAEIVDLEDLEAAASRETVTGFLADKALWVAESVLDNLDV